MGRIRFEIVTGLVTRIRLTDYPTLKSRTRIIQKGIDILRERTPSLIRMLSRQKAVAEMGRFPIWIRLRGKVTPGQAEQKLKNWLRRKAKKKLVYWIVEAAVIPFTILLAVVPGPNILFYVLCVLFYYHFRGWLNLRRIEVEDLDIHYES